jgi:hypothetical protein
MAPVVPIVVSGVVSIATSAFSFFSTKAQSSAAVELALIEERKVVLESENQKSMFMFLGVGAGALLLFSLMIKKNK